MKFNTLITLGIILKHNTFIKNLVSIGDYNIILNLYHT